MPVESQPPSRELNQSEQSFPLTSIVQLFTYCVALVTCVDFKTCAKRLNDALSSSPENVFAALAGATMVGFVIGAMIGLGQIRKWQSMFLSGTVGTIVGALLLATYTAPARPAQAIAASILPLASTILLRFRTP